jgi:carboxylesterase
MMSQCSASDDLSIFLPGTNGRAVLLIHGATGAPAEMNLVARRINRAGYTVSVPLLAGHGVDVQTLRRTGWKDWYDSICQAADRLRSDADTIFTAGICVGGMLGLRLAHDNEAVKGVTVFSPTIHYDGWNAPFYYAFAPFGLPLAACFRLIDFMEFEEKHPFGIKSDRIRQVLTSADCGMRGILPVFPARTLLESYRLFRAVNRILAKIRTPALLIHAVDDDLSSPGNAIHIKSRIGGPCEIEWLKNSYHMIHVDQEHPKVARRTLSFFDALG